MQFVYVYRRGGGLVCDEVTIGRAAANGEKRWLQASTLDKRAYKTYFRLRIRQDGCFYA